MWQFASVSQSSAPLSIRIGRSRAGVKSLRLVCCGCERRYVDHGVISSLVVETAPERTQAVAEALPQRRGVEVHGIEGRNIVITIETETVDESHDVANGLMDIEGVIGVNLIYLNFEDDKTIYPDGV